MPYQYHAEIRVDGADGTAAYALFPDGEAWVKTHDEQVLVEGLNAKQQDQLWAALQLVAGAVEMATKAAVRRQFRELLGIEEQD